MPQPMPMGGRAKRVLPFLLCLTLAACGSAEGGQGTSPTTTSTTVPPTNATAAPSTTSPPSPSTTQPVDAATALVDALAATEQNYRFVSSVSVDETVVTTIEGMVDGASVQATIATGDSNLSYVRTGEGEWTREPDGEWVRLEGDTPVEQPLAPLREPQEVELVDRSAETLSVRGRLGPGAGNAAGVEFTATITDGLVTEIAYQAENGGQTATVSTRLSEIGSAGSVEAPTEGT